MKRKMLRLLVLVPVGLLTSCGYGLKELVDGDKYNSTNWYENYYRVWDEQINVHNDNNKITETKYRALDTIGDCVFLSYDDENFRFCEPNFDKMTYEAESRDDEKSYGYQNKLSAIDTTFKYNVTSKLFDGQMFCHGKYEKARVQVAPKNCYKETEKEDGFARLFKKELREASYFAMNFKCAVDFKSEAISIPQHTSKINLELNFFLKNDTGYTRQVVTYTIDEAVCNSGDGYLMRDQLYVFFGFKLKNGDDRLDLTRLCGFGLQYTYEDEYSEANNLDHSILLYEVLLPYSTWY